MSPIPAMNMSIRLNILNGTDRSLALERSLQPGRPLPESGPERYILTILGKSISCQTSFLLPASVMGSYYQIFAKVFCDFILIIKYCYQNQQMYRR